MFQEVSLNTNGWHANLQRWMFGHIPFKNNFCPFFWLTIFCVIAAPFVGSVRFVMWAASGILSLLVKLILPVESFMNSIVSAIDKHFCKPWYESQTESFVGKMKDDDIHSLFGFIFGWSELDSKNNINIQEGYTPQFRHMNDRKRKRYLDRWKLWKNKAGDSWEEKLKSIRNDEFDGWAIESKKNAEFFRKKTKKEAEKREKDALLKAELSKKIEERDKKRKQLYAKIAVHTKYVFYLIIGVFGSYLLYWLGLLGILISENSSSILSFLSSVLSAILWAIPVILGALLGAVLIGTTVFILVKLIQKCTITLNIPELPEIKFLEVPLENIGKFLLPVKNVLISIKDVFVFVGTSIVSIVRKISGFPKGVTTFFTIYIKTIKENHCPAIKWDEE